MNRVLFRAASTSLCFICLSQGAARAASSQFIESFNTTTYKDAINTTALWETSTGQLKLAPFVPSLVGAYDTPDVVYDVAVSGDLAFVADYSSGLKIINITNPASPSLVGTYDTPGNAFGVAVAGDLAFVADQTSGLHIINITNPASPTLVGTYDTPGIALGVAISGDLAFVADYTSGLKIINITNPASPTLVSTCPTGSSYHVAVAGDLAFVADGSFGLRIVNITNPAAPSIVGTYDTPGFTLGIAVDGDLAFVADQTHGLQIININNPASPSLVGTYDTPGLAYGLAVAGNSAYVADLDNGLQMIDVTNPASPSLVGTYDAPDQAYRVAVDGELAFVADFNSGLQIVKVAQQRPPGFVSNTSPGSPSRVVITGDLAIVTNGLGIQTVNIANPGSPSPGGTYDTPGSTLDVAVSGDLAFVADYGSGLQIISIANPASLSLVGTYDTPALAYGVAVAGDLAFVADDVTGLLILNIQNPASPTLVGTYNTPANAQEVVVAGDLAFVADGASGLRIINITNPASPSLVSSYGAGFSRVAVAGDLAFVNTSTGFQVVSIVNPGSPSLVGTYSGPGFVADIAVSGNHVFVSSSVVQVVDISNPASPTLVGTYNLPASPGGIAVAGELAFVADGAFGLWLLAVLENKFDTAQNIGRSLKINGITNPLAVRLSTSQTAGVTWELSANAGTNWQAIAPSNAWKSVAVEGNDLRWRSTHLVSGWPAVNPTVFDLQVEWRNEFPGIQAITDIPNDQGGWVRLQIEGSGRDLVDTSVLPISHYGVWRRVDNATLATDLAAASRTAETIDPSIREAFGALPIFGHDKEVFVQAEPGELNAALPPGTWSLITSIPALQQESYLADVPTLADSMSVGSNHTVFVVTAHTTTPSIWYASPVDSGYSKDNIAPGVPTSFSVAYNSGGGNTLSWDPSSDDDFQYFRVYRSTSPSFTPAPANLVHATASTGWVDPDYHGGGVYYKVSALDYAGNESDAADAATVTAIGGPATPSAFALHANVPNPFNPSTVIRYDVPNNGGEVSLRIYDAAGRAVRTLVAGTVAAGQKSTTWDGHDDAGRPVASGVYFCRLTAPGHTSTRKMVLVK